VDLRGPSTLNSHQTTPKKHRSHASISITRGLKSLIESPIAQRCEPLTSPYPTLTPTATLSGRTTPTPSRKDSCRSIADSTWDMVDDDIPLRWATDYVPLAAAGSRLNTSVFSYTLWRDDNTIGKSNTILAVLTKCNILLYEALKGDRAFRFIKVSRRSQRHHFLLIISLTCRLIGILYTCASSKCHLRPPSCARSNEIRLRCWTTWS
jgi:hypothetical protein